MEDKNEPLPWDYFLSNYERDLLQLSVEDFMRKYSGVSLEQMTIDRQELMRNQEQFMCEEIKK